MARYQLCKETAWGGVSWANSQERSQWRITPRLGAGLGSLVPPERSGAVSKGEDHARGMRRDQEGVRAWGVRAAN